MSVVRFRPGPPKYEKARPQRRAFFVFARNASIGGPSRETLRIAGVQLPTLDNRHDARFAHLFGDEVLVGAGARDVARIN